MPSQADEVHVRELWYKFGVNAERVSKLLTWVPIETVLERLR